ncbi:MAG: Glutamate--tRNA ligase mitochondrial [Sclerophora amabilis]|nr:MAG: Glutamate--tRNA ligase mitochondrial [Sclerophora amabilis]
MLGSFTRASTRWRLLNERCFSTCSIQLGHDGEIVSRPARKLPHGPARTRFAPSPTGYLHLGSLRTALFNYLLAKSTGGQFLLRIEDTDQALKLEDLSSKRTALYLEHAELLLESGHAYRCFCSSKRLNELANHRNKLGLPTDYDRGCGSIPQGESKDRAEKGEAHVIRLKTPDQYPEFHDLVYGKVGQSKKNAASFKHGEPTYEDPILLKSDGLPTYHLANVVDDHHMEITHVVRAAEWMSSTPKHLAMYDAFKWRPPAFAHVGLLQNAEGQKLSKRNFDQDVSHFRNTLEILPEALVNYVALLGWSHDQKSDVMTLKQLVENFELKFTKGNTIVKDYKLWFLQKAHMRRCADENGPEFENVVNKVHDIAQSANTISTSTFMKSVLQERDLRSYIAAILRADAKNFTNAKSFLDNNSYYFETPQSAGYRDLDQDGKAIHPIPTSELSAAAGLLEHVPSDRWTAQTIKERITDILTTSSQDPNPKIEGDLRSPKPDQKPSQLQKAWSKALHHYLRWSIAAGKPGPAISETMEILGREESLSRLRRTAECC